MNNIVIAILLIGVPAWIGVDKGINAFAMTLCGGGLAQVAYLSMKK